jgi:hypothetical protein
MHGQQHIKFVMNNFTYCCMRDYPMVMLRDGDPTGTETCRSFQFLMFKYHVIVRDKILRLVGYFFKYIPLSVLMVTT